MLAQRVPKRHPSYGGSCPRSPPTTTATRSAPAVRSPWSSSLAPECPTVHSPHPPKEHQGDDDRQQRRRVAGPGRETSRLQRVVGDITGADRDVRGRDR